MMRENESDGDGGWRQPEEYVRPWAPRDEDEDAKTRWLGANEAPPPGNDPQDTIAFGSPPSSSGRDSQGFYAQPGCGNQAGYGQTWYSSQDSHGSPGHGSPDGYGQGGYQGRGETGDPAGHQAGGGYGAPGWSQPDPAPGRPGRGGRFLIYLTVAALAAGIGAGVTVALNHRGAAPAAGISSGGIPGPHDNAVGSGSSSAPLNAAAVAKKVRPGLVDITSTLKYDSETAEGTGMIISSSGLVLTNNHVIDAATAVRVTLVGTGSTYPARIVGYDATDDVALLQLQGVSGLPTETFGNSSQVSLGSPVLALGNADGRGGAKAVQGIINALNRSIQASDQGSGGTEDLNHMLQTDARIQQGDSGGALANNAGQVIGMITAANTSGSGQLGSSGGTLGYAIPINSALAIAKQIASGQRSATVYIGLPGFLGVEVAVSSSSNPQQQAADEEEQGGGGLAPGDGSSCQATNQQAGGVPQHIAPASSGALVLGVLCGTPASSQGLAPGDVILSVEGQAITTPDSLTNVTALYHPGDVVLGPLGERRRRQAHQLDGAGQRPGPVKTPGAKDPAREGHRAGQEAFSQARRRDSHSAILSISTYSPAVCAISEMPGP